jgi:phage regulator Rha-like protein
LKRGDNIKYLPLAFTEQGVMMLANVLKSKRAIEVSIKIIDVFILLRETLSNHTDLRLEIEYIKKKVSNHDKNIELVFQYLDELLEKKENKKERTQIGYKLPKKK